MKRLTARDDFDVENTDDPEDTVSGSGWVFRWLGFVLILGREKREK